MLQQITSKNIGSIWSRCKCCNSNVFANAFYPFLSLSYLDCESLISLNKKLVGIQVWQWLRCHFLRSSATSYLSVEALSFCTGYRDIQKDIDQEWSRPFNDLLCNSRQAQAISSSDFRNLPNVPTILSGFLQEFVPQRSFFLVCMADLFRWCFRTAKH